MAAQMEARGYMFGQFLLEQGVELKLNADLDDVLDFVDKEIPSFTCGDFGYRIISGKGIIGSEWKLLVKPRELKSLKTLDNTVGHLVIEHMENGDMMFKVPPRAEWHQGQDRPSDQDTKLFSSFIFQTLNVFQKRGYIKLPGAVPVA